MVECCAVLVTHGKAAGQGALYGPFEECGCKEENRGTLDLFGHTCDVENPVDVLCHVHSKKLGAFDSISFELHIVINKCDDVI